MYELHLVLRTNIHYFSKHRNGMRLVFIGTVTSNGVLYQSFIKNMSMGTQVPSLAEKN